MTKVSFLCNFCWYLFIFVDITNLYSISCFIHNDYIPYIRQILKRFIDVYIGLLSTQETTKENTVNYCVSFCFLCIDKYCLGQAYLLMISNDSFYSTPFNTRSIVHQHSQTKGDTIHITIEVILCLLFISFVNATSQPWIGRSRKETANIISL